MGTTFEARISSKAGVLFEEGGTREEIFKAGPAVFKQSATLCLHRNGLENYGAYFLGKMTRRRGTTRLLLLVLFPLLMFCSPGGSAGCVALPFVIFGWLTELTTGIGAELAVIKQRRSERPFIFTVTVRELES